MEAYGRVELTQAVSALAVGEGDVRSRLRSAFYYLAQVREDRLREDVRGDFEWVVRKLTEKDPPGDWWSRVDWNLHSMRNSTAAKLASRIVSIEARLRTQWQAGP